MTAPTPPLRYPITPQHPPPGVVVPCFWDGRGPMLVARVRDPRPERRGRTAWLTHHHGRPIVLPPIDHAPADPRRPYAGFHGLTSPEPDCWWPQVPERWALPLPDPLPASIPSQESRMWSERTRFQAVADAEAAELADEMHRDREAARARGADPDEAELPEKQWWLDPHLVTYSDPGRVGPREAEGRIMRALNTERWVSVERPTDGTGPPEDVVQWRLGQTEPNGRDRDDMLVALDWMAAISTDPRAGRLLRARSAIPAMTWRRIAKQAGLSASVARRNGDTLLAVATRLHGWALGEITREANGERTPGGAQVRARLEAVRAGNRAAKGM